MSKHHKKISAKQIFHGMGQAFRAVEKPFEKLANKAIDTQNHAIDALGGVGQSLAFPLVIVGGVILVVYLSKN